MNSPRVQGRGRARACRWMEFARSAKSGLLVPPRQLSRWSSQEAAMPEKKRRAAGGIEKSRSARGIGQLPEWNLADLYAGMDDPQIKQDLDRADAESLAFAEAYKRKLAKLAGEPQAGRALAQAVKSYEALDDLMGRLISYAGLIHSGNTIDPARGKFYADVQDRLTAASTHLLFFVLELNRVEDGLLEAAMQDRALGHYRP